MIDYIIFGLVGFSFIFVLLSSIFICKEKEFEDKRLKKTINSLLAGIVFLEVFLLSKSIEYGLKIFSSININYYTGIIEIVSLSLMAIFFLVGMILMKDIV